MFNIAFQGPHCIYTDECEGRCAGTKGDNIEKIRKIEDYKRHSMREKKTFVNEH